MSSTASDGVNVIAESPSKIVLRNQFRNADVGWAFPEQADVLKNERYANGRHQRRKLCALRSGL